MKYYPIKFKATFCDETINLVSETGIIFATSLGEATKNLEFLYDDIDTIETSYLDGDQEFPVIFADEEIIDRLF